MSGPPPWDDPVWAESAEKVDFATGHWTTQGQFFALRSKEDAPWVMPRLSSWAKREPQRVRSLEYRLARAPLVWVVALVLLTISAAHHRLEELGIIRPGPMVAVGVVGTLLAFLAVRASTNNWHSRRRLAFQMVEDDHDAFVCPVLVEVIQSGIVTGRDAGVAWFEEDALCFAGDASSFVIGRCDVHPTPAWRLEERISRVGIGGLLFLRHENRTVALHFVDAVSGSTLSEALSPVARRFFNRLSAFKSGPGAPEQRSYPPLSVMPELEVDATPVANWPLFSLAAFYYFFAVYFLCEFQLWMAVASAATVAIVFPLAGARYVDRRLKKLKQLMSQEDGG